MTASQGSLRACSSPSSLPFKFVPCGLKCTSKVHDHPRHSINAYLGKITCCLFPAGPKRVILLHDDGGKVCINDLHKIIARHPISSVNNYSWMTRQGSCKSYYHELCVMNCLVIMSWLMISPITSCTYDCLIMSCQVCAWRCLQEHFSVFSSDQRPSWSSAVARTTSPFP